MASIGPAVDVPVTVTWRIVPVVIWGESGTKVTLTEALGVVIFAAAGQVPEHAVFDSI